MISPTRTKLIDQYVRRYLRETGAKRLTWAEDVAMIYCETTPLAHQTVQFHRGGDVEKAAKANRQIIDRMLDDDCENVRFPADLEEAVVRSLPDPYGRWLRGEIAARYGHLVAELPAEAEVTQDWCARAGSLLRETGEALEALAPVVADGKIDKADSHDKLAEALRQVRDVQALSAELCAALEAALADRARRPDVKVVK